MPEDTQIFVGDNQAGSSDYEIPGNAEIRVKAVNANFVDNGAGADWCPAVVMFSDSGSVIARALLPDVKVAAGDDAEVSWFPGVKPGGGTSLPFLNQSFLGQGRSNLQTIPSGAVTPIGWTTGISAPGYGNMFGSTSVTANPVVFVQSANVTVTLTVIWPAANYDRYCELAIGGTRSELFIFDPRVRHGLSPDGDLQTLCAVIDGGPGDPTTITAQVFQASGVDRAIRAGISYNSIPYGVAPYVAP